MAFNTIIFALIAIASIVIFLLILNSIVPNFMGRPLCKVYQIVLSLPLPKQLKPHIPGCSLFPTMERVVLQEELSNANILANYLVKCWEKSQESRGGQTFICYELFMKNVPNPFRCGNIAASIPVECVIDRIEGKDLTIIIKYNSEDKRIEVI